MVDEPIAEKLVCTSIIDSNMEYGVCDEHVGGGGRKYGEGSLGVKFRSEGPARIK